jgi:prolyl-tRNA synthetase
VSRIVAAAIEQSHDDKGIIFPINIAPFEVVIAPIGYDKVMKLKLHHTKFMMLLKQLV